MYLFRYNLCEFPKLGYDTAYSVYCIVASHSQEEVPLRGLRSPYSKQSPCGGFKNPRTALPLYMDVHYYIYYSGEHLAGIFLTWRTLKVEHVNLSYLQCPCPIPKMFRRLRNISWHSSFKQETSTVSILWMPLGWAVENLLLLFYLQLCINLPGPWVWLWHFRIVWL